MGHWSVEAVARPANMNSSSCIFSRVHCVKVAHAMMLHLSCVGTVNALHDFRPGRPAKITDQVYWPELRVQGGQLLDS
jgi:hypothetical protein